MIVDWQSYRSCCFASVLLLLGLTSLQLCQVADSAQLQANQHSFDRGVVPCKPSANFTYVISSDVQLWWWKRDGRDEKRMGESTNWSQLDLYEHLTDLVWPDGRPVQQPTGLVINGDITSYGKAEEWDRFRALYDSGALKNVSMFPGLGNHDVSNNLLLCWDWGIDSTTCARRSIEIMRQSAGGTAFSTKFWRWWARMQGPLSTRMSDRLSAYDWGSGAYSWLEVSYHFIMLHFHPAFSVDMSSFNIAGPVVITPSYDFLEKELAKAKTSQRKVVLFIHDIDDNWAIDEDQRFMSAMVGSNVVAIFCGHWHSDWGLVKNLTVATPDTAIASDRGVTQQGSQESDNTIGIEIPRNQTIPIYRSGSSEYQTSILAEFSEHGIQLQIMTSSDQQPSNMLENQTYWISATKHKCKPPKGNTQHAPGSCRPHWQSEVMANGSIICRGPCPSHWELLDQQCQRRGCGSYLHQSGAMCYPPCKQGYHGVGPVCWQICPEGWDSRFLACVKHTECDSSMDKQGGLCFPKCKDGYQGVGPVCMSTCPDDYSDDGLFCRRSFKMIRKSYCCSFDNLACCNNCPTGLTDMGCKCRRSPDLIRKQWYIRGAGQPTLRIQKKASYGRGLGYPLWATIDQDYYLLH